MNNRIFKEDEIPYGILNDYGLTHEMIDDLPQEVMKKLLSGSLTPKLPLTLHTPTGDMQFMSKLRLYRNIMGDVDVFFMPELETSKLSMYNEEEQKKLLSGNVITSTTNPKNGDNDGNTLFFIQYDEQINQVLSVPVQAISNNVRTLMANVELDENDVTDLMLGLPVTNKWKNRNGSFGEVTFGIDLRYPTGFYIVNGDKDERKTMQENFAQKYNFGLYGVWIADGDSAFYVKEEDYTDDIKQQMSSAIKQNQETTETRGYRR